MSAMLLLLSGLALLGAAVGLWLRRRAAPAPVARPVPVRVADADDALPGSDDGNGLAAFYAYQMAASRIERA